MTPRRGLPWLVLAAALVSVCFGALGLWQLDRMAWKHALVGRIEARTAAAPVAPPAAAEWPGIATDPAAWEYRRLQLEGHFLHDQEALVQATTALGAGHWVLTPLQLADGRLVLVNRGFVPPAQRTPSVRGTPASPEPATVTGLLRLSEPGGGFLRSNDPAADRWFSRDVAAIAQSRHLPEGRVAPFFVDAEMVPAPAWPRGGLTVLRFSDNHLVYALTWFVLAALSAGAVVLVLRQARSADGPAQDGQAAA